MLVVAEGDDSERSSSVVVELEPDWLKDMKLKQARGEIPSLSAESSWAKSDVMTHTRGAGKDLDLAGLGAPLRSRSASAGEDAGRGSSARMNAASEEQEAMNQDSGAAEESSMAGDVVSLEDGQGGGEDGAYLEHHGNRVPLLGNAGKDVGFLRRLREVWRKGKCIE